MNPRIYSDYNGPYQPDFMLLTYYGTQKDLEEQNIELKEGMKITVYSDSDDEEDLEADGIVKFGQIPNTRGNPCWYADTRGSKIRYVRKQTTEQGSGGNVG